MEILIPALVLVAVAIGGLLVRRSPWNGRRETRSLDDFPGHGSDPWFVSGPTSPTDPDPHSSSLLGLSGQDFPLNDQGNRFEGIDAGVSGGVVESHVGAYDDFSGNAGGGYFESNTGGGDFGGDVGGGGDSGGGDSGGGGGGGD